MGEEITQEEIIKEYYKNNPGKSVKHKDSVPWLMKEYKKRTGKVFADPDRGIRKLSQQGFLIKENKGIYKYDSDYLQHRELEDFSPEIKKAIFDRDGHRCVICGKGKKEGVEIHADHIKPKDLGGKATLENGQTLCGAHNYLKKNFKQTETGKKMFIRLYELARFSGDEKLIHFCSEILEVFEKNNMNGHIEWKR